jgi:DNA-binding response OmpR family regulator
MTTTILWIEGSRHSTPSFVPGLRNKGFLVSTVSTGREALSFVSTLIPDLAVVNAASFGSSGERICGSLRSQMNEHPILLIGDQGREYHGTHANQVLLLPFTIIKLVNRIKALAPVSSTDVLLVGSLALYPEQRVVRCKNGEHKRLTPRLVALLEMFMKHQGEVIKREHLFREVWETNYVEDTRTLDVHINWLREKIEEDHRNPELIKTVRGVGYYLDV